MTSIPSGSFEVGGKWTFNVGARMTGDEGASHTMHGACVISFADSSRIEISVSSGGRVTFEDPAHHLTCELELFSGEDRESLAGTVMYDGSAVSAVMGSWKSRVMFDNWECWHRGQYQTAVKVADDNEEGEEADEDNNEEEYRLIQGTWVPVKKK